MLEFITQLDPVSKLILIMLFTSLAFALLTALRRAALVKFRLRQIRKISKILDSVEDIQDLNSKTILFKNYFVSNLINSYIFDFQNFLKLTITDQNFNNKHFDMLHSKIAQKLETVLVKQMASISVLSTLAQSTPLIGTLGTICGLFYTLKFQNDLNIKELGISGLALANALCPMIIGLFASISSLVLFSYLQKRFSLLEQELIELTDKFYWKARLIADNKIYNSNAIYSSNLNYQQKNNII